MQNLFPSVLWHCWLGDRKGIWHVKNWVLVCWWWWWFDWYVLQLQLYHTSITLRSNKIQNRDILVLANPGPSGKWRETVTQNLQQRHERHTTLKHNTYQRQQIWPPDCREVERWLLAPSSTEFQPATYVSATRTSLAHRSQSPTALPEHVTTLFSALHNTTPCLKQTLSPV